jgi:hypothetical protein
LQESDVFQNIPNERFHDVRSSFEKSLNEFSKLNPTNGDIVAMNKEVIPILLSNVHTIANSHLAVKQNKKIEVIYKADDAYRVEDIHKRREEEFNNKFQEQQNNMNELLQPKRPKEVSFADKAEDKPIGGEMDQLIQQMLTSRERELEIISASSENTISDAKTWLKPSATKEDGAQEQIPQAQAQAQGQAQAQAQAQAQKEEAQAQAQAQVPLEQIEVAQTNDFNAQQNFVSMQTHPISEIVLEPYGIQQHIPPKTSFMDKLKKKDPIKELADEVKELKQQQTLMMEQITQLIKLLEK